MANTPEDAPRSSGIYGLFNLGGEPVEPQDMQSLGLSSAAGAQSWRAEGHDAQLPQAVSRHQSASGLTLLVGEVEETDALSATLGLQPGLPTAALAEAALARFGNELPAELIGEWSLLHRANGGRLTLMVSAAMRDRLHYTVRGNKIAVSPNLFALGRISWVSNTLCQAGLLFPLGRAEVRAGRGDSTMLKSVFQIGAGSSVVIAPNGSITKSVSQTLIEQSRWQGSYSDAVGETETLLRRIMRTKLAPFESVAPMLSGGLDSSLLTWLCAEECGPSTRLLALTSVAPPDSQIADEARYADIVAQTLGIKSQHVFPAHDVNIYRPPEIILGGGSGPILSNRHCLTDAFQIAAKDAGAKLIIDGTYGELTATARLHSHFRMRQVRTAIGRMIRSALPFGVPKSQPTPFHVRLAPHLLADLPKPIRSAQSGSAAGFASPATNGLLGYMPGVEKALALPNEFYPGAVRMTHPYRDIRLLRLFASFPLQMLVKNGADRGVGRSIMAGHFPDAIRLRRRGMPASPDHFVRLQRQASAARNRIPHFRAAEVDDWLDLNWLDQTLQSVSERGPVNVGEANEVQLTAIAAEFLLWWRLQT